MEKRAFDLRAKRNSTVVIRAIPGHFATRHSHVNCCIDMTKVKSQMFTAKAAARLFAESFANVPVETIITLERTKMVGAFLANELSHAGININLDIAVISPEITDEKLILRDNMLPYVKGRHVLLLSATSTTGPPTAATATGSATVTAAAGGIPRMSRLLAGITGAAITEQPNKKGSGSQ